MIHKLWLFHHITNPVRGTVPESNEEAHCYGRKKSWSGAVKTTTFEKEKR